MAVEITSYGGVVHKLNNVHSETKCGDDWCIIHNPVIPHSMRKLIFRNDKNTFEELCECGVGHPVLEDFCRDNSEWLTVHGCCGIVGHCERTTVY